MIRLLVKEILVSDDRIVIRHSIPLPTGPSGSHDPSPIGGYSSSAAGKSYLLRSGSGLSILGLVGRTTAETTRDPEAKRIMFDIAESYDRLAETAAQ